MVAVDAVVLMGGRASRLGGTPKGDLRVEGRTLLERVVDAASAARELVVVGDPGVSRLPDRVRVVREEPPFGGPAAAVGAGVAALPPGGDAVLLLAGDLPFVADAVPVLLDAFGPDGDGVRAVDETGRQQHLTAVVRRGALERAIRDAGELRDAPLRSILAGLRLADATVPAGSTLDVDTWDDARAVGAVREGSTT